MVKAAGILSIIGGIVGIIAGAIALGAGALVTELTGTFGMEGIGGGFIGLGIVALIGGICTLRRKSWGFSLAGAICAMFPIVPLGVLSIIFVSARKKEFTR